MGLCLNNNACNNYNLSDDEFDDDSDFSPTIKYKSRSSYYYNSILYNQIKD